MPDIHNQSTNLLIRKSEINKKYFLFLLNAPIVKAIKIICLDLKLRYSLWSFKRNVRALPKKQQLELIIKLANIIHNAYPEEEKREGGEPC